MSAHLCGVGVAIGDRGKVAVGGLADEDIVIGIDKGGALFGSKVAVKLCLGADDPLEAAKAL